MRISTRSRYGLRLMINLAANYKKGFAYLKDIAKEEDISEKYLSQIVIPLKREGMLVASRGVHGGYSLACPPSKITARQIIEVLEGDLALIECTRDKDSCERSGNCSSLDLWAALSKNISDFLGSVTLQDLVRIKEEKKLKLVEYCI